MNLHDVEAYFHTLVKFVDEQGVINNNQQKSQP